MSIDECVKKKGYMQAERKQTKSTHIFNAWKDACFNFLGLLDAVMCYEIMAGGWNCKNCL